MNSSIIVQTGRYVQIIGKRFLSITPQLLEKNDEVIIEPPENLELAQLNYEKRRNDSIETKKARLVYQSRKRGMLENDLLLSTFAAKYLTEMTPKQVDEYDLIINLPSNDWDLYYWAMGKKPTPPEFNNSVMEMLKLHVKNLDREPRRQPTMEQM